MHAMTGMYVWILMVFSVDPLNACPRNSDAAVYARESDCHAAERVLRTLDDVVVTECRKLPVKP